MSSPAYPPGPAWPYTYQQPHRPPLPRRSPRALWWFSIVRPWAIVVPLVTLVMDIWWFATGRLCDYAAPPSDECFWVLWLSLPLAVVSLGWNMATTISARRIAHYRRGIPSRVQLPVQSALASGATVCLALLAWHYAAYMDRMWESHLEGAMVALIAIITLVNWLLVGFTAYEWNLDRRYLRDQESYVL
ncbi:hypothetical protein ACRE_070340 [Hapsidospora chrysogenum ATCC 11550]|uniref:Uncharacterized protein n=1 Tax=Hapsidospora chrysogenum (strain ATCC 11550 / CBS 779.69 / DSM 880 / IAM 14645 / JCM 23072 / IMI 49137) TaxID=857340 RepID=A0A086SYP7_HAPC1|nr:hypothetical protein ACRE_070340 [Hapsidospora chrysogenum ATCC 11550]